MNSKCAGWTWLFRVGIFTVLTAPCLQAADKTNATPAEVLPLDNVRRYVYGCDTNTSLQNARAVKELIGKYYRGVVVVADVGQASRTIEITVTQTARMAESSADGILGRRCPVAREGCSVTEGGLAPDNRTTHKHHGRGCTDVQRCSVLGCTAKGPY